ncbi:DUF4153 domain-containing protein [Sphingomonas sp.]|uniref:DUF4153 domain-containing protein n=1 Tax=Sphingomonas sp. TaxID=28214 RepID=UPI0017E21C92|nr:DUF4153 domain-containing protein [Sphingomonas sp.]MBA4762281.1 DUF4153 domain-containing protein [Sphingomonas sp.]
MSEAVEQRDERWPLLPPALAVLGLATGLIVHWIVGTGYQPEISAVRLALLSFVSVSAILFGFVVIRTDLIRSAMFALGCGAVAALILYFNGATSGWSATEGWRLLCLALAIGIAAPLFQAGREGGFRPISYPLAHDHAWTNAVLWCLSWAFVGVVLLLAYLLAALFDLIGIDLLSDLLREEWFWRPLVGLAFGLGLALLREQRRIVGLLQDVAMLVLGVLAPVLAVGLGLFLIALPFTGLQPLWEATKSTTPILLACAVGALLLVNAVIGNGGDDAPRNRVLRWAALVLAVAILPLVGIAAVATGLRIGQYGFTPERLWGLTFVGIASVVAVAYLASVVRGRGRWPERVRPANLDLAMIVCGVALLLATPLVSFNAISTRDQVARLESGKVSPDKFDWAALAFDFGEPGRKALDRLKASDNAVVRRTAADIAKKERRWEVEQDASDPAPRLAALEKRLRILPRPVAVPPGLGEVLMSERACGSEEGRCTLWLSQDSSEALVFQDDCFDRIEKQSEPTTFHARSLSCTAPRRFVAASGKWTEAEANELGRRSDADRAAAEQGFKSGTIEVRPVQRRQVFVGGVPVGDPFE